MVRQRFDPCSLQRSIRLALFAILVASLLARTSPAQAAPIGQDDPAAQCAEGVRLFRESKAREALPLLEAGFARREAARFEPPDQLGLCALALGLLLNGTGNQKDALEAYIIALAIFTQSDNRAFKGTALTNIGAIYKYQGRYAEALEALQQALVLARAVKNPSGEGSALNSIGVVYAAQGYYDKAMEYYQQALVIRQAPDERSNQGDTLNNIGDLYRVQGRYTEALETFQQALDIWREVDDRSNQGTALNNIGAVYQHQGRYQEALDYGQQALALVRAAGIRTNVGLALNNIGSIYNNQGRYTEALDYYQQGLAIAREVGNRASEGTALNNIGTVYQAQGQYALALETFQQALAIRRAVSDRAGEGITLDNIGTVYQAQGSSADALGSYLEALAIKRAVGDRAGEATTHNNIGINYSSFGSNSAALKTYEQALAIQRAIGDRAGQATTLNNIGAIHAEEHRYAKALVVLQQALEIRRAIGDPAGQAATLINIGWIYGNQQHTTEALDHYQQTLDLQQSVGDRAGQITTLTNIGWLYDNQQRITEALNYYQQAIDGLEGVRASAGTERVRAGFIARYANLYTRAVLLYYQQGQDELAFATSERGRARAFLDSLSTGYIQLSDQESQALFDRERETYVTRQKTQDALARARAAIPLDPQLITDLERQLNDAEGAHTAALEAITGRAGELATLVSGRTVGVRTVDQVQALLDPSTTLVSFFVTDDKTLAFVLTHDHFTTVTLPVKQADLRTLVETLHQFSNMDDPYPPGAIQLYQQLIVPLQEHLTTRHLAIVPHGVLHYMPFAALTDGTQLLIDNYVLTILPSASSLPFIQANSERQPAGPLILGNPATDLPDLPTLAFAEREAEAIAALYKVEPLIGPLATEHALEQRGSQAGIVHLAAHASFNPIAPLASAIYLASDTAGIDHLNSQYDGRLEVGEVYRLDLHEADLVVLSACDTQLGDLSEGDELVGLTRAFIFAGAPSVMATLWNVEDKATSLLMERFYTHLQGGVGKAEALRQAQLDVRVQYPNPYYWAGFVLSGDGGKVTEQTRWIDLGIGVLLALLMLGMAGGLLVLHRRVVPQV
jgi:CHAT domain-containing protein/Tfp pilus assembly protein PilF